MSGLFEKKAGRDERREARAAKERREEKKTKITAIIIAAVLVVLFAGALFINSGYIRRTFAVITVGGIGFTAVEYDYFYYTTVSDYRETIDSMGFADSGMLPSSDRPHSSQIFDPDTGETWADYFNTMTVNRISAVVTAYNAAMEYGYVMPDERREFLEESITEFRAQAEMSGFPSMESFFRAFYNTPLNERSLRNVMEYIYVSNSFREHIIDSFTYSAEELAEEYFENRDTYDVFTFRYFQVSTEEIDILDFESIGEYEAARENLFPDAVARAEEIASEIRAVEIDDREEAYISAARSLDEEMFEEDDSTLMEAAGGQMVAHYDEWIVEDERTYGDVGVFPVEPDGVIVLFYIDRDDNSYYLPEMRQILIMRDEEDYDFYDEWDDFDIFDEADESMTEAELRERAESVLALFVEGGATEQLLIDMMDEHSDDWSEGGLYTEIQKGTMVPEIDGWLFDPDRQVGDYELIFTEAFGYHLVFLSGFGEMYRDMIAGNLLRERDYELWSESLGTATSVRHRAFFLTSSS